jgi:hypothetical protein
MPCPVQCVMLLLPDWLWPTCLSVSLSILDYVYIYISLCVCVSLMCCCCVVGGWLTQYRIGYALSRPVRLVVVVVVVVVVVAGLIVCSHSPRWFVCEGSHIVCCSHCYVYIYVYLYIYMLGWMDANILYNALYAIHSIQSMLVVIAN